MTSPPEQVLSAAKRFAATQHPSSMILSSQPSWDDLQHLLRNPYLISTEHVDAFVNVLDSSTLLLPFVWSISLEDRSLTVDAYTSEWPLTTPKENETWTALCKYISILSSKHNLRNLSLAVTASKRIQEDIHTDDGKYITEPAKVWSEPVKLDCLALSGCDLQQPALMRCFTPKETIIYTAAPAWGSVGLRELILSTTSSTLDMVVGSFPTDGAKTILSETIVALHYRSAYSRPQPKLLRFRLRQNLPQQAGFETAVKKVINAGVVGYSIQIQAWQTRGATQLEAERADWADGTWLNRATSLKAQEEASSNSDEGWDACNVPDAILFETLPDSDGDQLRDRIDNVLAG